MKRILLVIMMFIAMYANIKSQPSWLFFYWEVQTAICSTAECSVTIRHFISPLSGTQWSMETECIDPMSETGISTSIYSGSGVYSGSACGGSISF